MAKTGISAIDDIRDFFDENPEVSLNDLDSLLLVKLIVHALDQCIGDSRGNPPEFIIQNDFILMEIEDKRFSIAIRDNNKYS